MKIQDYGIYVSLLKMQNDYDTRTKNTAAILSRYCIMGVECVSMQNIMDDRE